MILKLNIAIVDYKQKINATPHDGKLYRLSLRVIVLYMTYTMYCTDR